MVGGMSNGPRPLFLAVSAEAPLRDLAIAVHASEIAETDASHVTIKLLPAGSFSGRDGRGPWVLGDEVSMQAVIAATRKRAGSSDVVVDYDHQTQFAAVPGVGGNAPAAGWIKNLEARPDGIYADVAWTEAAQARIRAGEYRYISPVYMHDKAGRVKFLVSAGLTNTPNLDLAGAVAARALPATTGAPMDKILQALGLAADADEAAVIAAVNAAVAAQAALGTIAKAVGQSDDAAAAAVVAAVQSQAVAAQNPDPRRFVPAEQVAALSQELATLKSANSQAAAAQAVEAAMAAGKVQPALKDWAIALHRSDPAAFATFIAATPAIVGGGTKPAGVQPGAGQLSDLDLTVASAMGLSTESFLKTRKAEENV